MIALGDRDMNLSLRSTTFTLANGLRVVVHPDATISAVAVAITHGAGSQHDPPGLAGIAHLVEHLTEHGTSALGPLKISELVESNGGMRRAYTTRTHTRYESIVPKSALSTVLWAEAERMDSLRIDEHALAREQQVILEEMRVLYTTLPYAIARDETLAQAAFAQWPNRHATVGTAEGVRCARLADVRAYYDTYYGPNNAVLALAGDIDVDEARRLTNRYFAHISPRERPPALELSEPPLAGTVRHLVGDRFAPVPLLIRAWPAPPCGTTDAWALMLAAAILGPSGGSPLYRALSHEALEVRCRYPWWGDTFTPSDPDLFGITIALRRGASGEAALAAADGILSRLSTNPIDAQLLAAAKNQIALAWTTACDPLLDRARVLSVHAALVGDPAGLADDWAAVAAITPAQVADALRAWIVDRPHVIVEVMPDPDAAPAPAGSTPAPVVSPPAALPERPRAHQGAARPAHDPQRRQGAPPVDGFTLSNGLEVQCIHDARLPLLELRLLMRGGPLAELDGEEGSAAAAADFIASQLEAGRGTGATPVALGWMAAMASGMTDVTLRARGLSRAAPQFIRAAAAAVTAEDGCTDAALSLWCDSKREELRITHGHLAVLATERLRRSVFGTHPFGRPDLGDRELGAITQAGVRAWRRRSMSPDAARLMLVGDADPAALRDVLEEAFAPWTRGAPAHPLPSAPPPPAARAEFVGRPGGGTFVILGQTMPFGPVHPDYLACVVANEVLGGGSSLSRLHRNLRVDKGYTYYSLYSQLRPFGDGFLWVVWAGVRAEVAAAAFVEIQKEIARLRDDLVPLPALDEIKRYVSGRFLLRRASIEAQADTLVNFARGGQDVAYEFATCDDRLAALTPDHVRDAVWRGLDPGRVITVVAGESAPIEPLLIA
jgi:zinc protease